MGMDAAQRAELRTIIGTVLRGELTGEQADRANDLGREATRAIMLAASARLAELAAKDAPGPHTPSGAIPPYSRPSASKRGRKRPGARNGHAGRRRPTPEPDERVEVEELKTCPECHGEVMPAGRRRERTIEDMPLDARVRATEYSIPSHWCPRCKKRVEPRIGAALPRASIGNRLAAMTVVFHYGLGLTIEQTREVLLSLLRTRVSAGGLVDLWRRIAGVLLPWYEQIGREARDSATLHADETGWRVDGDTHWPWCFGNHATCWYMTDEGAGRCGSSSPKPSAAC